MSQTLFPVVRCWPASAMSPSYRELFVSVGEYTSKEGAIFKKKKDAKNITAIPFLSVHQSCVNSVYAIHIGRCDFLSSPMKCWARHLKIKQFFPPSDVLLNVSEKTSVTAVL